jgi:hypothetical protein
MRAPVILALKTLATALSVTQVQGVVTPVGTGVSGKIDQLMQRYHSHRHFHGAVLVAEDGEVIYSRAFGRFASIRRTIQETRSLQSTTTGEQKVLNAVFIDL